MLQSRRHRSTGIGACGGRGAPGRRLALMLGVLLALVVPAATATVASAALPLTPVPTFKVVQDENGADDQPGQKDLSLQGTATPQPGDLWTMWQWDDTSLSGGNTGDACALFDTNANSKVNFAVCVTIQSNPAVQAPVSPRVYTCGDGKVDRCTSTYTQITPINTACATNTNATDPFHNGKKDTQAICHIALADVGGASTAKLVNTCSYPSQTPTSDPSDCVLVPRDAFVTIRKITDPASDTTTSFPFNVWTGATEPTGADSPSCSTTSLTTDTGCANFAIQSGKPYSIRELVPANWGIDPAHAPSCTGASGAGTSNGTVSGALIQGLQAASDNVVTCTYYDKKLTGAIEVTKLRSGTTTVLAGAHFSVDGSGDYVTGADGKFCVAGLAIGSHTVTETTAPNGHTVASPSSQTVNVTSSGTCASGATTASFSDPVVPGTITIHKSAGTMPLGGATFTLYVDNPTVGGTRTAADTITTKTCTTDATTGDCTISAVALGDYWVVETTAPNGYTKAADQSVNVGVGATPGTGDTDQLTFTDLAAPGTFNIHKTGNGGPLGGATFTLYPRALGQTAHGLPFPGTQQSCTTNASGDCSITDVTPGDYWIVETTTPAGYDTAADVAVTMGLGSSAETGATVNVPTIDDPVVPGTVNIHKTGLGGAALAGATFTLYTDNAPTGGSRGSEDVITTKTCTTGASGDCSISSVGPRRYWVVETTTPNGYDTAPEQNVTVGIGATAHVGDTDNLTFADPVVNGKVSITKTDDASNALQGAVFTLYANNAPTAGPRGSAAEDPATTKTCTTSAAGTCDITDVPPGNYWVVETTTPAHYETAADKAVTIGIGAAPHVGDTQTASFVDPRKHRVVVVVCHEGTDTLFSRDVTVGGVTKQSLPAGSLSSAAQKALCDTGGASFGDIAGHGHVSPDVDLGTVSP